MIEESEAHEMMEPQKPEIKVSKLAKLFKASFNLMKDLFLPYYELANKRVRGEKDVLGKGSNKLTHEQVPITYSIGSNFVNSVYFKSPNVNLTAREEVDHQAVENTEIAVNDWLQDKKVKKVVKRAIWDAYKGGFGAVFIDYAYDDIEDPNNILEPAIIDPITGQEIKPPVFGRTVLKNEITIQRLRPDLFRFPRGFDFDNYQESPWLGFDMILPIDEIKSNKDWNPNVVAKIDGEKYDKITEAKNRTKPGDGDQDLYGKISYDLIKPENPKLEPYKLVIFCDKYDEEPLQVIDFKKGHVGYPIHPIYFNPLDDDNPYPKGDAWMLESQLNAVDDWWKKVVRHIRRSNPKFLYDASSIDNAEANKLKSNNDNEYIGLKNKQGKDIRALVSELNAPGVPKDLTQLWEVARQLISEIAPKSSLSGGAAGETDSATEAKIIATGEMIDVDARIDDVKDFIKAIVLDVAGIMSNALAAPIPLKRENPAFAQNQNMPQVPGAPEIPEEIFEEVGSEGFTDKVNIDVEVESMQAQNKDVIRRQLLDMLGLFEKLGPLFQAIGEVPDPKWWVERIMETSNIKNIDKGFKPINQLAQPIIPQGAPVPSESPENISGEMPPEAVEAGMAQRV